MKRIGTVLLALCLSFLMGMSALADVIYEPDDDFLQKHEDECHYENRVYIASGENGYASAKKDPKSKKTEWEIPNGTCILVTSEDGEWCEVSWGSKTGYCRSEFLVLFREADLSLLDYRVLQDGDKGEDVLALKKRLKELGYIRGSATLTNRYTKETAQRVTLFQRQAGMTEDGIAWQELQVYLYSDKAPACTQTLPRVRTKVADENNRMICGCCMGEGCECCNFTGWVSR